MKNAVTESTDLTGSDSLVSTPGPTAYKTHLFVAKMLTAAELVEVGFELSSRCLKALPLHVTIPLSCRKNTRKYFIEHGRI